MPLGKFRPRELIQGLSEAANRELKRIQVEIKADLDRALALPIFQALAASNIEVKSGDFARVAPRGAMVVTLEQPRRDNQGLDTRLMVEDMTLGTLTVRAHGGTVNQLPTVQITQPGMVVCTSNGVSNYALTFAAGTASAAAVEDVDPFTVVANPSTPAAAPTGVAMALHSLLARIAGDVVAYPFASIFGGGLTYDEGTGTVSASDMAANTVRGNPTSGTATPQDVPILEQSVLARDSGDFAALEAGANGVLRRAGTGDLSFGSIVTNNIGASQVTTSRMADLAPGTVLGQTIDGATGAPVALTGLEQGENLRRDTSMTLTLDGDAGGSGSGGEFTEADITVPAEVTTIIVRTASATTAVVTGWESEDINGHEVTWVMDITSPGDVHFAWDSVESAITRAILFPVQTGAERLALTGVLDSFTFRHMSAVSAGSPHWTLVDAQQVHSLNLAQYTAGVVKIHDGTQFVHRTLNASDISGTLEAITANGGLVREVDNIRLADIFGTSIWANLTTSTAAPTNHTLDTQSLFGRPGTGAAGNLTFGTHQLAARFAGTSIVTRSLLTLFGGTNLSYSTSTEQVSATMTIRAQSITAQNPQLTLADSATVSWTHGTGGGVSTATPSVVGGSLTPFHLANIPANTVLANPTGGTAAVQTDLVNTHTFYGRKAGTLGDQSLSGLAGSNMAYDSGAGVFNVTVPSSGGRLLRVSTPADFSTSGTFSCQAATRLVVVEIRGGGGGGGGAGATSDKGAAGGGEGAFAVISRAVTASATFAYTVGSAGSAGSTAPSAGGTGGSTSITIAGSTYTAGGGTGGQAAQGAGGTGIGGAGGTMSGSTTGRARRIRGKDGGHTPILNTDATTALLSGAGGGDGGGRGRLHGEGGGAGIAGQSATGGGGGGAFNEGSGSVAGGAGGTGYIVIYEYS